MLRPIPMVALTLAGFLTIPSFGLAQDTVGTGTVRGRVIDSAGRPVPGAVVCASVTGQCTESGTDGAFRIEIRPGTYRLDVVTPSQPVFVTDEVQVRAGLEQAVEVALPPSTGFEESITVTASTLAPPVEVKTSGFVAAADASSTSASALQDVARFVQTLPGAVIGTDDFRNDIIVRGGSPLENLYIVDNIEIPNINTFATFASAGGSVSILDAQLIDNVTFLTGGYPAPYGNRTSSVLQVAQREGQRDRTAARATLGFAGAGFLVEGPIGSAARGSWVLSMRRSFLDLVTDDVGIGGVPVLYTVNAKAVYDFSPRDRVWAVNVSGVDNIRLGLTEDSDPTEELANLDIRYRGRRSATGLNWQRLIGSRGVGLLGVTHTRASVNQRITDLLRDGVPAPGTPVDEQLAAGQVVFRENSGEAETTLKYDLTLTTTRVEKVQAGASLKVAQIDYDSASPFGTDSPFFPVADVNPFSLRETSTATQASAYVQATQAVMGRAQVTAGLRADRYGFNAATRVSPRIGANVELTPRVALRASAGQYYQQPFFLFLAAYPENRSLKPYRADHYVGGVAVTLGGASRLTVEAYRKNYRDYPVSSQIGPLSLANVGDTFAVRDTLFPMVSGGRGEATGVEFFVERRPDARSRWHGEANLAFSRSRFSGIDGVLRPGSFDYPIVANAAGTYRVGERWRFSGRMAYLAGRPYTPFDETMSAAQRRGVYDLDRVNDERAADYFRLDLRVDRTVRVGPRAITVFAGAQNVTNRANVAGYSWDRRANVVRTREQLAIFPTLGLEWRF